MPQDLATFSPLDRIRWAARTFPGGTVATSSFGADSAVLLHLISIAASKIPILFVNSGFLFDETLAFKATLEARLGLHVREVKPLVGREEFLDRHGPAYEETPGFCCERNKVFPLRKALEGVSCWISGIRADQAASRARMQLVESHPGAPLKLHPLLDWEQARVDAYIREHDLPRNPLVAEGYTSIGCWPCTALPADPLNRRSGRWSRQDTTECGSHVLPDTKAAAEELLHAK